MYPNLITMKTILLKTYLQEMIFYIHTKSEIKESKTTGDDAPTFWERRVKIAEFLTH